MIDSTLPQNIESPERAIASGTGPVRILRKIRETWRLDGEGQAMATLLGFDESDNTLVLDILAGSERRCTRFLRGEQAGNEWLRERHPGLGASTQWT